MPAETFFCPHCKRQLTKGAQSYVMGEMITGKDSHFIALGSMPDTIKCPGCGGQTTPVFRFHTTSLTDTA